MERKQVPYTHSDHWDAEKSYWVVKRWCIVHAKTGTLAQQSGHPTYATREACQVDCDNISKNNSPDTLARYFPSGVRPAEFWCYESHGDPHSAIEQNPTFITLKHNKKADHFQWLIYGERTEPVWIQGEKTMKATKEQVLDIFPDAVFSMN